MNLELLKHPAARRSAIAVLAAVTLAGVVAGREKPALELVEARSPQPAVQAAEIDLAKLQRADAAAPQADPFAPKSFAPPPPPPQASAPAQGEAARPSAPPLPFRYAGKLIQDGNTEVFVLRGEELISIAAGQNIDGQYRVDTISDSKIAFTYLPLKTRQAIELEEAGG